MSVEDLCLCDRLKLTLRFSGISAYVSSNKLLKRGRFFFSATSSALTMCLRYSSLSSSDCSDDHHLRSEQNFSNREMGLSSFFQSSTSRLLR